MLYQMLVNIEVSPCCFACTDISPVERSVAQRRRGRNLVLPLVRSSAPLA